MMTKHARRKKHTAKKHQKCGYVCNFTENEIFFMLRFYTFFYLDLPMIKWEMPPPRKKYGELWIDNIFENPTLAMLSQEAEKKNLYYFTKITYFMHILIVVTHICLHSWKWLFYEIVKYGFHMLVKMIRLISLIRCFFNFRLSDHMIKISNDYQYQNYQIWNVIIS